VRLQDHRLQAHLGQLRGDVLGGLALAGPRVVAVVGGVDPDQVAADADDLVLRGHLVLCHPSIVALGRGAGSAGPGWVTGSWAAWPGAGCLAGVAGSRGGLADVAGAGWLGCWLARRVARWLAGRGKIHCLRRSLEGARFAKVSQPMRTQHRASGW